MYHRVVRRPVDEPGILVDEAVALLRDIGSSRGVIRVVQEKSVIKIPVPVFARNVIPVPVLVPENYLDDAVFPSADHYRRVLCQHVALRDLVLFLFRKLSGVSVGIGEEDGLALCGLRDLEPGRPAYADAHLREYRLSDVGSAQVIGGLVRVGDADHPQVAPACRHPRRQSQQIAVILNVAVCRSLKQQVRHPRGDDDLARLQPVDPPCDSFPPLEQRRRQRSSVCREGDVPLREGRDAQRLEAPPVKGQRALPGVCIGLQGVDRACRIGRGCGQLLPLRSFGVDIHRVVVV